MKFCDKLQKIRKENNVTQEQLADKLDVSRQAVSKWESGGAYPDTEKLIQISKIFNVSLDELINGNEIVKKEVNNKMSFMDGFNEILNFISKTVNMFWAMSFKEKVKCVFEMLILILALSLAMTLLVDFVDKFGYRIFKFLPEDILYVLKNVVEGILYFGCSLLLIIIVVKIFKTRYLDYYVIVTDDSVKERTIEKPIEELKERKNVRVVIRDPEHSSYNIIRKISNFFLFIFKCICIMLAIPAMFGFVLCIVALVISLFYVFSGLFFNGITLAIIGGVAFMFLVLQFMFNIVFNRKHNYGLMFILLIASLSLIGIGSGLSVSAVSKFDYIYRENDVNNTHIIEMKDNLIIPQLNRIDNKNIIIDNSLDNIKMDISSYKNDVYIYSYNEYDAGKMYEVIRITYNYEDIDRFKEIINDFKHGKVVINDSNLYEVDKIYISESNLTKLRKNSEDYYDYTF